MGGQQSQKTNKNLQYCLKALSLFLYMVFKIKALKCIILSEVFSIYNKTFPFSSSLVLSHIYSLDLSRQLPPKLLHNRICKNYDFFQILANMCTTNNFCEMRLLSMNDSFSSLSDSSLFQLLLKFAYKQLTNFINKLWLMISFTLLGEISDTAGTRNPPKNPEPDFSKPT